MKLPGPDHPITIEPSRKRMRGAYDKHVIADTTDAVILREADYPPVIYFPIHDVDMAFLTKTAHTTHCPYKGDASYWSIYMDGDLAENAVWGYETPFESMSTLKGRVAFYPNVVDIYALDEHGEAVEADPKVTVPPIV